MGKIVRRGSGQHCVGAPTMKVMLFVALVVAARARKPETRRRPKSGSSSNSRSITGCGRPTMRR